jgi:NAD(P) transhydrogenase subunit alpha
MDLSLVVVFVLASFLGFELISKVPATLHTPLMSGSNAISGITVVGAILVVGTTGSPLAKWVGFAALIMATINVVGGFLVTDRMLEMFKPRETAAPEARANGTAP